MENTTKEFIVNRSAEKSNTADTILIAVGKNISDILYIKLTQTLLCNVE